MYHDTELNLSSGQFTNLQVKVFFKNSRKREKLTRTNCHNSCHFSLVKDKKTHTELKFKKQQHDYFTPVLI